MASPVLETRQALLEPVRTGVERVVLPALGQAGRAFELEVPALGRSSLVFLGRLEGGEGFVVRVGRDGRGRKDLRRRRKTAGFWTRHGLPTPRVLHADLTRRTLEETGFYFLCEARVEGGNAVDGAPGSAGFAAVGRAFARVHGVERRFHHGSFHQPRVGPFGYRLIKRHGEWTRALAKLGAIGADLGPRHREWLRGFPALRRGGPFQLHHRRCTESDVMVDSTGEAWVLEPHRCGFGSFLTDLVRIEERICRGEPESIAVFHAAYFDAAPGRRPDYDALADVFRADLYLANALRWARKAAKGEGGAEAELSRELERFRKVTGV